MVKDLRSVLQVNDLAEELDVSERTVYNWQNGERPMGMKAIRVYLLHVKLCNGIHAKQDSFQVYAGGTSVLTRERS